MKEKYFDTQIEAENYIKALEKAGYIGRRILGTKKSFSKPLEIIAFEVHRDINNKFDVIVALPSEGEYANENISIFEIDSIVETDAKYRLITEIPKEN